MSGILLVEYTNFLSEVITVQLQTLTVILIILLESEK